MEIFESSGVAVLLDNKPHGRVVDALRQGLSSSNSASFLTNEFYDLLIEAPDGTLRLSERGRDFLNPDALAGLGEEE